MGVGRDARRPRRAHRGRSRSHQGGRQQIARRSGGERAVARRRAGVRRGHMAVAWPGHRRPVSGRLSARTSPQRGQRLRVRPAVRRSGGAGRTAAADPVPWSGRRARTPRRLHRGRRCAHRARQLDLLRLRRAGAAGRGAHAPTRRLRRRIREQPGRTRPAPGAAGERALRRRPVLHPGRRQGRGHAPVRGPGGHRGNRRGVRARLHPGGVRRHQGPVRGVHVQRLRRPRPPCPVLPARGFAGPVRLPQAGHRDPAGIHRREDARLARGAPAGLGEPGGDRAGRGRRGGGQRMA